MHRPLSRPPIHSLLSALVSSLCLLALYGCSQQTPARLPANPNVAQPAHTAQASTDFPNALFENVTDRAGIRFRHANGATGKYYDIEPMAGGCAFIDYDNDGLLDILLIQSGPSDPLRPGEQRPHCALYHNNGDGTFTDVTAESGLDRDLGYGMGVAVGDYDNDGYDDLLITSYGGNHLFHNENKSKIGQQGTNNQTNGTLFRDVTHEMGLDKIHSTGYATSAAFGDYDNDGRLDIYICYYSPWSWNHNRECYSPPHLRDYCTPDMYEEETHQLFHNEGSYFKDVSEKAGISKVKGRGLAVAFYDYNEDGKKDIFVANDIGENMLWHNNGNGTFVNRAAMVGVARDETGHRMAGMGIAIADYNHSGHESLFVTNFALQPNTLFKNSGNGLFTDVNATSGLGPQHMPYLSFGCEFFDYDADGWPDLITANGHVTEHVNNQFPNVSYKEPDQLFHNEGDGTFRALTDPQLLGDLATPALARGLAVGDFDNDGHQDLLIVRQNDTPLLLRNRDRSGNHWVSFKTVGTRSNRDGLHARITLTLRGEKASTKRTASVRAGSSYLAHSDTRVYFGLGKATTIERVEIQWPSGTKEEVHNLSSDRFYVLTEGHGVTRTILPTRLSSSPSKN